MKIINRAEFLKLPEGTVYFKGERWCWGQLCVKTVSYENDWRYIEFDQVPCRDSEEWLVNQERMLETGESMPMVPTEIRDGSFEDDDLFLVYDNADIKLLKEYLETY